LPRDLIMAPLDLTCRVYVALVQFAICVSQFANLGVSQVLQHIRSVVAEHIFAPMVLRYGQKALVIPKLHIPAIYVPIFGHFVEVLPCRSGTSKRIRIEL